MAMKWFRKHNKKIMIVGGTLLMVAFLLPRQRGCQGRAPFKDRSLGQAFGTKIMLSERNSAAQDLDILQRMGMPTAPESSVSESMIRWFYWQHGIRPRIAGLMATIVPGRSTGITDLRGELALDYALLRREAQQMRLPMGEHALSKKDRKDISILNGVANFQQLAAKIRLQDQRRLKDLDKNHVINAIGNYVAVIRAQELILGRPGLGKSPEGYTVFDYTPMGGLAQPSEKQLEMAFRNIHEQLAVEYVSFPAWRYGLKVSAATDSEIREHFEAYEDKYAGSPDNEFGFGYKQPLRLKVEYIKVELAKVKAQLQRPSPEAVREYYDRHKQLYVLPSEEKPDLEADTAPEPVKQYKPFEQVYEDLENRWLQEQGYNKALEMIADARRLAKGRWEQLKREQKGATFDPASLYPYGGEQQDTLVKRLNEKFKVLPQYYESSGWIDPNQAESLPGIGISYSRTQPMFGFLQLASRVRQPSTGVQDAGAMSFELGQDCPVSLVDAQGNMYLFRVIGLRREEILNADQVVAEEHLCGKVAADLLAQRAYEHAREQARKLLALAQQKGLEEALAKFGDKDLEIRQAGMITRSDAENALLGVQVLLVNERGKTLGRVDLGWQDVGPIRGSEQSWGILELKVTNQALKGRITALGLNLPRGLRLTCQAILSLQGRARNGGDFVPAGPQGYTLKYFGRGIDAGEAGKFDLLISAEKQELATTGSLSKGGIEPGQSESFPLQLPHAGSALTAVAFARSLTQTPAGVTGIGSVLVARLETGGKSETLRGVFPANRQAGFLRDCFVVLDRPDLRRRPGPASESMPETQSDQPQPAGDDKQVPARTPDLLTESLSDQAPCALIELPRRRLCYVISAPKHLPLSRAEFSQQRRALLNSLAGEHRALLARQWWASSNIRLRAGYRGLQADEDAGLSEEAQTQTADQNSP